MAFVADPQDEDEEREYCRTKTKLDGGVRAVIGDIKKRAPDLFSARVDCIRGEGAVIAIDELIRLG